MKVDLSHAASCPIVESFDPLSAEFLEDPFRVMALLPDASLFYAPKLGYYIVRRYADVEAIFRDHEAFSAAAAQLPLAELVPEAVEILQRGGHKSRPSMVSLDPPEHTRLRRPTAQAFTPQRVNALMPQIRATTHRLLDSVEGRPVFDIIEALAFPLPAFTIFTMLGVPEEDIPQLRTWCGHRAVLAWGRPAPEEQVSIANNLVAYHEYLRSYVSARASELGEDLTSALLALHKEDPGGLTVDEIVSILFALTFAGHETTSNLIGNLIRRLLEERDWWEQLAEDPGLAPASVDEVLRYDPPVPAWRRIATRPASVAGYEVPEGAKLFLWLAAANRDPQVFSHPDVFDPRRADARGALTFGKGIHYCLGANLGRLEAQLAVTELITRFPRLRLVPNQVLTFPPTISFRGPQKLMVETGI